MVLVANPMSNLCKKRGKLDSKANQDISVEYGNKSKKYSK